MCLSLYFLYQIIIVIKMINHGHRYHVFPLFMLWYELVLYMFCLLYVYDYKYIFIYTVKKLFYFFFYFSFIYKTIPTHLDSFFEVFSSSVFSPCVFIHLAL